MDDVLELHVKRILEDINKAIKQFGEYAYFDKGAQEVMDIDSWIYSFRRLPASEAAAVLRSVVDNSPQYGELFVSAVLTELQEWDELFEEDKMSEYL